VIGGVDHYAPRGDAHYVGPLLGALPTATVDWPEVEKRIFAYLRPEPIKWMGFWARFVKLMRR